MGSSENGAETLEHSDRLAVVETRQYDHELFATEARNDVLATYDAMHDLREQPECVTRMQSPDPLVRRSRQAGAVSA